MLDGGDAHHATAAAFVLAPEREPLLLSTVNYAEVLVRPALDERTLRLAVDAITALEVRLVPPTAGIARDAARFRAFGVSLADGFALATARAHGASLATFDQRVRTALARAGVEATAGLR